MLLHVTTFIVLSGTAVGQSFVFTWTAASGVEYRCSLDGGAEVVCKYMLT